MNEPIKWLVLLVQSNTKPSNSSRISAPTISLDHVEDLRAIAYDIYS